MSQVKCISILKALPGQPHEEFASRWVNGHAPIPASWKNLKKYSINIPNLAWHKDKGEGCLFDGTAELYWDSYEEMLEDMNSPLGEKGNKDAEEFVSCCINLYCEEHVIK